MLYHASHISGLKQLKPQVSTHGNPYVYAIRSKLMAILFGAPKDDFDLLIDAEDGKAVLYECYPDAVKRVYSGKGCSVYTVEESGFQAGMTGWEEELVCSTPVTVVSEENIADLYREIMKATEAGICEIHYFEQSETYLSFLRDELQERVDAFGISQEYRERDSRFVQYHNSLLNGGEMNAQQLYDLAMKHIYGDGVPEDNDRAFVLLTKAQYMGHVEATYNLGICYHYGFGTDIDLGKAYTLYLKSAEGGYGKGMELVGRFYNRGIHVEKNREKAQYWLRKAIQTGETDVITEAEKELAASV